MNSTRPNGRESQKGNPTSSFEQSFLRACQRDGKRSSVRKSAGPGKRAAPGTFGQKLDSSQYTVASVQSRTQLGDDEHGNSLHGTEAGGLNASYDASYDASAQASVHASARPHMDMPERVVPLSKWKEYSKIRDPTNPLHHSPHKKEMIKAAAIKVCGGAMKLTTLMQRVDALSSLKATLARELVVEKEQRKLFAEKLGLLEQYLFRFSTRRASTPHTGMSPHLTRGPSRGGGGFGGAPSPPSLSAAHRESSATFKHANTAEEVGGGVESVGGTSGNGKTVMSAPVPNAIGRSDSTRNYQRPPSTKSHRRKVLRSFLWGGAGKGKEPAKRTPKPQTGPENDDDEASVGDASVDEASSDVSDLESVVSGITAPTIATEKLSLLEEKGTVGKEASELDLKINAEGDEIARLSKERDKLLQKKEDLKRDIVECRVGWQRCFSRVEREIATQTSLAGS